VLLKPARLHLGELQPDQTAETAVAVQLTRGLALQIQGIKTSSDRLAARVEADPTGNQYQVHVTLTAPAEPGEFHGWVQLITDDPHWYNVIGIPVVAQIRNPAAEKKVASR
jgi:hypothetical protein